MNKSVVRTATVDPAHSGARLDQIAARMFPEFSRARLQAWIRSGHLRVDGRQQRPRDPVAVGAVLSLDASLEEATSWEAQALPLAVLYEDEDLLVVDKPAGLVVHPGAGNRDGTLVNALLHHRSDLEGLPRAGIVHRLDKDTSGLLVVAASLRAHHSLVTQLQDKTAQREYFAIARGRLTGGATINAPIGRHPTQRTRMAVRERGGRAAVTHYRLAERFGHFTALQVSLETGRTHQIRVHLAHRGYPLLGDPVYGGRQHVPAAADEELLAALQGFRRQALHARRLSFTHPGDGGERSFESPLPGDLLALLAALRKHDPSSPAPG
jgi:23S rRNA pseudouridine1911/1915/1917 synthase